MVVDLGHTLLMAAYNRREEMNAERVEEDVVRRGRMHVTHQPPTTAAANGGQCARLAPPSAALTASPRRLRGALARGV